MTPVTLTIPLPDEVVQEAEQVGLFNPNYQQRWAEVIQTELRRAQAAERLRKDIEAFQALPDEEKPTLEEIDAAIAAYRAERYK